jgi:hypothetical protein
MIQQFLLKLPALLLTLIVGLMASSSAFGSATIVIQNGDAAGVGFNDTTPLAPVGGNAGATLGQQRLNAFQFAANVWGATLNSGPTITIHATWESLPCAASSGTLGTSGATNIFRDFPGAPFTGTQYSVALANSLSGIDQNGSTAEINARFNIDVGTTGCLDTSPWYLGLDGNHGAGTDLVAVLLHEFAHGLGFQTFTSSTTGAQNSGFPSVYDRFLFDNSTGKNWTQMTNAERVASAINTGNLVWIGPRVISDAANVLGTPRLRVNSPAVIAGNYQVGAAEFGPRLFSPGIAGNLVQSSPSDACSAITNSGAVSGKIAVVDRGNCNFTVKVKNAQNAGATGVVVVNNVAVPPLIGMSGADATITIPSVLITQADGVTIRGRLGSGVNVSLLLDTSVTSGTDPSGRPLLYAPNPLEGGSSVSHWDTTAFPNQLMEPFTSDDLTHSVLPPQDLTFSLLRDIGWAGAAAPTIQLSQSSYFVNEGDGHLDVLVTRGDTTGVATVNYATSDAAGLAGCTVNSGNASERCDYATTVGTLRFAAGEGSKTFTIPIIDDALIEGNETFTVTLSGATGASLGSPSTAPVTIVDNDTTATTQNPIDGVQFFVTQQYIDFLGRLPDSTGLANWMATLNGCPNGGFGEFANPGCDRVHVSAGFFQSDEFQGRGYWAYLFYEVALDRRPLYAEFVPDMAQVGGPQSPASEALSKAAYTDAYVLRTEFMNRYALLNNTDYVNMLETNAEVTVTNKQALIDALNLSQTTRALVLRNIVESPAVNNHFFNRAFVAMQYFGYLRRDPDTTGYNNWVTTLTNNPSDYRHMIFGFLFSPEYRSRFGSQ